MNIEDIGGPAAKLVAANPWMLEFLRKEDDSTGMLIAGIAIGKIHAEQLSTKGAERIVELIKEWLATK